MNPTDRKYSKEHEWVKIESGDVALVGITHFAQDQLGDIVFVYFPDDLENLEQFKSFGEIESPKAVSELFAPVSGPGRRGQCWAPGSPRAGQRGALRSRLDAQSPTLRLLRNGQTSCPPTSTKPSSPSLNKTSAKLPPTDNADKP